METIESYFNFGLLPGGGGSICSAGGGKAPEPEN